MPVGDKFFCLSILCISYESIPYMAIKFCKVWTK